MWRPTCRQFLGNATSATAIYLSRWAPSVTQIPTRIGWNSINPALGCPLTSRELLASLLSLLCNGPVALKKCTWRDADSSADWPHSKRPLRIRGSNLKHSTTHNPSLEWSLSNLAFHWLGFNEDAPMNASSARVFHPHLQMTYATKRREVSSTLMLLEHSSLALRATDKFSETGKVSYRSF